MHGARIAGVVSCVPSTEVDNARFVEMFGEDAVRDVVKMIGVQTRRHASPNVSTADLCLRAGQHLLTGLSWSASDVDAVIFVSQTPNYVLPATAFVLQAGLGLSSATVAFDVNLGCSGYPYALWLGACMIRTGAARKVLLAVGDTISKIVDPADRSTALLFGDAGTVTALEADTEERPLHFVLGSDGGGVADLIVPQGSFKTYDAQSDARMQGKAPECLFMDGSSIFNFTLKAVPGLVSETLALSGWPKEDYDAFLFHQANLFMLKHLVKKAGLPAEKAPFNIDRYGNTSSASIPLLMTTTLASSLRERELRLGMFGFGVGFSWAGAALAAGPLEIVETIEA